MKKYKLLKDYATPFCFVPAGTVGEVDGGYYNFTSGEDGFSFPAQDVRKAPNWFEEIKESFATCGTSETCLICERPILNGLCACVPTTEKEECKHEKPNDWVGNAEELWKRCPDCHVCYEREPQPKEGQLKPGEWIEERANELIRAGLTMDTAKHCATLDFLDSVAEGKYKLEP